MKFEIQNPNGFDTIPNSSELDSWIKTTIDCLSDTGKNAKHLVSNVIYVIRFVDVDESIELNHQYRDKNSPTNVLSFPNELPEIMMEIEELKDAAKHIGDLILCEPVVKKEAVEQNKSLTQHWAHLIIHGVLHLHGYDHIIESDAEIMEALEIKVLQNLGYENPYHN